MNKNINMSKPYKNYRLIKNSTGLCFVAALLSATCLSNNALAGTNFNPNYNFDKYIPTLDNLFTEGTSPIKSGYSLVFSETDKDHAKFTYYKLEADNSLTPIYYNYQINYPENGATNYGNITSGNGGNDITGYFFNNTGGIVSNYHIYGGTIYNDGSIGNIKADFVGNYQTIPSLSTGYDRISGGVIANMAGANIASISGDFIGNYTQNAFENFGSILYNEGTIGKINSNFIANYTQLRDSSQSPHMIYNIGSIEEIRGSFINNDISYLITNDNFINEVSGTFIANKAYSLIENQGTINSISGSFIGNEGTPILLYGYSNDNPYVKSINGIFINNKGTYAGAIANINVKQGRIDNIQGDFISNHVDSNGGAISNHIASIGNIDGNFIGNYASGTNYIRGGAIYNTGEIEKITGKFHQNYVVASILYSQGGAIYNSTGNIGMLNAEFNNNYAEGTKTTAAEGGALYNRGSDSFENSPIVASFNNNYAKSDTGHAYGGAIANSLYIDVSIPFDHMTEQTGEPSFKNDKAYRSNMSIKDSSFQGNQAIANSGNAHGGAIAAIVDSEYNVGYYNERPSEITLDQAVKSTLTITNSSFYNNSANSVSGEAKGGAIYSSNDVKIIADKNTSFFAGNKANDENNAIYMAKKPEEITFIIMGMMNEIKVNKPLTDRDSTLTLEAKNDGKVVIYDSIAGDEGYKIAITGDNTGKVIIGNDIINAGAVSVDGTILRFGAYQHEDKNALNWDGHGAFVSGTSGNPVTTLSLNNAVFDLFNQYQDIVELKGYSATDSFLHLDVDVENMTADMLNVNGDVVGTTKLVLYPTSNKDISEQGSIVFAQSTNDTTGNAGSFEVFRVYSSPYLFDIKYESTGTNENKWSLEMNDKENPDADVTPTPDPDPDIPDLRPTPNGKVYAEVMAYTGLHSAAIEQTRSMLGNVFAKVAANKILPDPCLLVKDEAFDGNALYNAWVNPIYHTATIDAPVEMDVDIWGLEAGFDIQRNQNHKLGVFASYRQGEYDLNGKGKKHYSPVGSEIDIDSYIGGLYYRYDYRHLWAFATLYGGVQQADIKTDDGVKADTDGTQLGGSIGTGYLFNLSDTLKLEPSLNLSHTQIDFDDVKDRFGKTAKYKTIRQTEIELGAKLEKYLPMDNGIAKVYVKPSVVQVISGGDKVAITSLDKTSTYEDGTLGRMELGGRYAITDKLSTYGYINYTFGSDYDATSLGLGLNYSF